MWHQNGTEEERTLLLFIFRLENSGHYVPFFLAPPEGFEDHWGMWPLGYVAFGNIKWPSATSGLRPHQVAFGQKNFTTKFVDPQKLLTPKNVDPKNFWPPKILTPKIFDPQKFLTPKNFWPQKILTPKNFDQKILTPKIFDSKICWPKKMFNPVLVPLSLAQLSPSLFIDNFVLLSKINDSV